MVTRRKLRTFLTTLGLYVGCALVIGYFGVNAYTGNHGLRAQQDLDQQFAALTDELGRLKRSAPSGSAGSNCCNPTASTRTRSTSGRGRSSTISTRAT